MSFSICHSLTRFTKHNILFSTTLLWTSGPCCSWRLRRGRWLASRLPPPRPHAPALPGGGGAEQTGRGRWVFTCLALSLLLPQLAVFLPFLSDVLCWPFSHGCFPGSSELCKQPCPPVFPYPGNLSLLPQLLGSLSLEEAVLGGTQDGCMGTHLFLSQDRELGSSSARQTLGVQAVTRHQLS